MSVLVRGMKMPKNGWTDVRLHCDGSATMPTGNHPYYRLLTAVEVQPHGRLIDADALIADIKRQCREVFRVDAVSPDDFWITRNEAYNERLWGTWCESFFGYLKTRPTIIEAEEGET